MPTRFGGKLQRFTACFGRLTFDFSKAPVEKGNKKTWKVLEDLFRMLPPLKSSNFVGLKEELEAHDVISSTLIPIHCHFCLQALWTQCSAGQNDALTEKLAEVPHFLKWRQVRQVQVHKKQCRNMFAQSD